ncbi:hypothetical protein [Solirubrobacter soli]|uniref:hypothetical protein n=1 Tax=Solirubrobacter soli TaxID=363832 RepID=UPI00041CC8FA|nr:hypothetical protein [Solirubrobacter soli]
MIRSLFAFGSLIAVLVVAAPAQAAAPSCQRAGAKLLAASGNARVVSVKEKAQNSETRRDRIYGCWTTTGRRFTLFLARDFGLDLIERDHIEIVDGRYIGVIRSFEGGVSESQTAATWDASKHVALRNSKPCDEVSTGDFSGVDDAVFYRGGGMAYSCNGSLRLTDGKGDREVEPPGAKVAHLAVSANSHDFIPQLFYVADTTPKTIAL